VKDQKDKKESSSKSENTDVDRRKFIKKSARDLGMCGYAIFELAKTIREEIVQEVIDDIKEVIKRS